MRPYRALLAAKFRGLIQYRVAAVAGICTQFFWGVIRVMSFAAFYRSSSSGAPLAYSDTVTYLWLGQAFLLLLPWRPDPDVADMVRTGNIAYELVKPVGLYPMWYMRSVAMRVAPTVLRCPPVVGLAMLFLGMRAPPSWQCAALFSFGLVGAVLLGAAVTALLTISVLWTLSSRGIITMVAAAVNILSGSVVPLPLFPGWAQGVLAWQPFRGLMDTPFRLYLGHLSGRAAALALLHQLGWTVALILLGRSLVRLAQRRVVVQGG
jgi:ABC-2 type transport system permease protein